MVADQVGKKIRTSEWFIAKNITKAQKRLEGIHKQVREGKRPLYRTRKWRQTNTPPKSKKGPPGPPTIWLPNVSETLTKKIKNIVKSSGLELQVKAKSGQTLKQIITNPNPKIHAPIGRVPAAFQHQSEDRIWPVKDCVYRIECLICKEQGCKAAYCGETAQPLNKRLYQHDYACRTGRTKLSAIAEHHAEKHPSQTPKLEASIVARGNGFVQRKAREAIEVQIEGEDEYSINRRTEGATTVALYW